MNLGECVSKMECSFSTFLVLGLLLMLLPVSHCDRELTMQIIATERGGAARSLSAAASKGIQDVMATPVTSQPSTSSRTSFRSTSRPSSFGSRLRSPFGSRTSSRGSLSNVSPIRKAGISLDFEMTFTSKTPHPDEILDLFCDQISSKNVSVITTFNYDEETISSNDYILNLARYLGYPVISWDTLFPGALQSDENSRVLQIAPTIFHQCQAMLLLLERYNWTQFSIVTTKDTGTDLIDCMDEMVIRSSVVQGYTSKARFTKLVDVILEFDAGVSYFNEPERKYTQKMLKRLIRSKSRVMFLHSKLALDIVEEAETLGLTSAEHMWILTSLSVGSLASTRTRLPPGMLAVYPNSTDEKIGQAIQTAIRVWAGGLEAIINRQMDRRLDLYGSFSCDDLTDFTPWKDGEFVYSYMKEVEVSGSAAPPISFTDNGILENVELEILNIQPGVTTFRNGRILRTQSWESIGRVVPQVINNEKKMVVETNEIVWPGMSAKPPLGRPEQRSFRITTKEEHPYIVFVPPDSDGSCGIHAVPCTVRDVHVYGNESQNATIDYCCTGLCVEMLEMISETMNFRFHLYEVPDGQWGVLDPTTNEWNGLIREILDDKADMILTAFIINNLRSKVIDLSVPFLDSGITIMVSIRKGAISPYAFLEPYDFYSWILILIFSVHATGGAIFIFEWLSPSGLDKGNASTVEHKFSLFRSFWLIWAMLFGAAVSIDVPKGVSSRFLSSVWALFALVFLASYTANLAAFMITLDKYYDLSGIEDWRLLNPTKINPHFKFATIPDSSTEHNLKVNYPNMHKYMTKYNQSSVEAASQALKDQDIHAFIYDANVLEYTAGRDADCELLTVGKWYAMSGYGIGFKRGSPIQEEVNDIILDLQHSGEIERLQDFWQAGACHAKKDKKDKSSHDIGILNFISAFILLAAGVLLGLILLALEHLYFKSGRKCLRKYDKNGCCALVSLSMGKSLTFEQSVFEAIDIQRKHKCKDPICEMHLWKARHQLDMALLKIKQMQTHIDDVTTDQPEPSTGFAIAESEA